jgi:uncharacterized membrane protein
LPGCSICHGSFVYHSLATDSIGIERFKVMERRLYRGPS